MKTITAWTCQSPKVLAQLMKTGFYCFGDEALAEKFGAASDYARRMYSWYTHTAGKFISLPEGCAYPIWLAPEKERLLSSEQNPVYLRLEIPAQLVLQCNLSAWEYRMNSLYIPCSAQDAQDHAREMAHWGAGSDPELMNTHRGTFFPHLRKKIQRSWDRVFTQLNVAPGLIALTAWELRKEWIREIRMEVKADAGVPEIQHQSGILNPVD